MKKHFNIFCIISVIIFSSFGITCRGNQQVTKIHATLSQYYKNDGTLFANIDSRADGKIKEVICTKIE